MGEIADGLINGDFDSITGEYLGEGFGFPRTKHKGYIQKVRRFKKSSVKEISGLRKYMSRFDWIKSTSDCNDLVFEYCSLVIEFEGDLIRCSQKIQEDFGSFVTWIKKQDKEYKN